MAENFNVYIQTLILDVYSYFYFTKERKKNRNLHLEGEMRYFEGAMFKISTWNVLCKFLTKLKPLKKGNP